jgi:hypothetical protein
VGHDGRASASTCIRPSWRETVRHARLGFHCHALAYHSRGALLDGGFEEPNGTVAGWLVRQRLPID